MESANQFVWVKYGTGQAVCLALTTLDLSGKWKPGTKMTKMTKLEIKTMVDEELDHDLQTLFSGLLCS
jgi:hypothetical protein